MTGEQFAQFLDEMEDEAARFELVAGTAVPVSPPPILHSFLHAGFVTTLGAFLEERKTSWGAIRVGVYTQRKPDSVRIPDLAVISRTRLPASDFDKVWVDAVPELLVEILSTSDRWSGIHQKIVEYQKLGVECLWLVDPIQHCITEYHGDRIARYQERDTLNGEGLLEGFRMPLRDVFTP